MTNTVQQMVTEILSAGYTPEQIAIKTDSSVRSVQRWSAGETTPKKIIKKKIIKMLDKCRTSAIL